MSRLILIGALAVASVAAIIADLNYANLGDLQAQLTAASGQLQTAAREAEQFKSKIGELTTQVQDAAAEQSRQKSTASDLAAQLASVTAERDSLKAQLAAATQFTAAPKSQLALTQALMDAKQYDKAAAHAQEAINDFFSAQPKQTGTTATAPTPEELEHLKQLRQLAFEGLQLATTFVPPPESKDHGWGGLFNAGNRSFGVNAVPIPVEYEFDSTEFTPKGQHAAATLLAYLKSQPGLKSIKLEGHTDDKGSAEYNFGLSKRRADALAAYLAGDLGSAIAISTVGKGKDEPVVLSDTERYTKDEIDQINRRVVLVVE